MNDVKFIVSQLEFSRAVESQRGPGIIIWVGPPPLRNFKFQCLYIDVNKSTLYIHRRKFLQAPSGPGGNYQPIPPTPLDGPGI